MTAICLQRAAAPRMLEAPVAGVGEAPVAASRRAVPVKGAAEPLLSLPVDGKAAILAAALAVLVLPVALGEVPAAVPVAGAMAVVPGAAVPAAAREAPLRP